jgi:hypothetical protein
MEATMKRLAMFMAAAAAFSTIGCGEGDGVTPGVDWELLVHVEGPGHVHITETASGIDTDCSSDCD